MCLFCRPKPVSRLQGWKVVCLFFLAVCVLPKVDPSKALVVEFLANAWYHRICAYCQDNLISCCIMFLLYLANGKSYFSSEPRLHCGLTWVNSSAHNPFTAAGTWCKTRSRSYEKKYKSVLELLELKYVRQQVSRGEGMWPRQRKITKKH